MKQIRQGDVFLLAVQSIPTGAELVADTQDYVILKGSSNGNAHRASGRVQVYQHKGDVYFTVPEDTHIKHSEHPTAPLPAGTYMQIVHTTMTVDNEPRRAED